MKKQEVSEHRKNAAAIAPALRMALATPDQPLPRLTFIPGIDQENIDKDRILTLPDRLLQSAPDPIVQLQSFFSDRGSDGQSCHTCIWPDVGTFRVIRPDRNSYGPAGRLAGRVALVTGAGQGFGRGIADGLADAGAYVVLADINGPAAEEAAEQINDRIGKEVAMALTADVTSEESVDDMIESTVLAFGGLDLLVSNAGIVRAGSLDELSLADFRQVTEVNYTAFFLCARSAAVPMKTAARMNARTFSDIVQINSKSGLEGSNRNFAYAGSKFGGIGLVQSFALELAPFRIKVNAVCPGNYFEGPLWSDPDRGLFVQYLKAGKIPGANTVRDVYDAYAAKVPLGRGCRPADVTRAILYLVEQEYETGQALPVTGGQVMLK